MASQPPERVAQNEPSGCARSGHSITIRHGVGRGGGACAGRDHPDGARACRPASHGRRRPGPRCRARYRRAGQKAGQDNGVTRRRLHDWNMPPIPVSFRTSARPQGCLLSRRCSSRSFESDPRNRSTRMMKSIWRRFRLALCSPHSGCDAFRHALSILRAFSARADPGCATGQLAGARDRAGRPPAARMAWPTNARASKPNTCAQVGVLGQWQLHAHPNLIGVLCDLAPEWPLTAAYGVPLLACEGGAAVVALGTDWLAVRIDDLPADVETDCDPAPEWSFAEQGWHVVPIWHGRLRELIAAALANAGALAAG
jgi:hypothetical protein